MTLANCAQPNPLDGDADSTVRERKRVFLHIGQPKTGSTSLQAFFHLNRQALGTLGFYYPEAPQGSDHPKKHSHLLRALLPPKRRNAKDDMAWPTLLAQIESSSAPNVVLSEELLWPLFQLRKTHRSQAIDWMAGQLSRYEVRIICYLRRQSDWVESLFNQSVKGAVGRHSALSFSTYLQAKEDAGVLDYRSVLSDWARAFGQGQMMVRCFEPQQLVNGDVIDDFCAAVGLPVPHGLMRPEHRQLRLETPVVAMALAFRKHKAAAEHHSWLMPLLRDAPSMSRSQGSWMSNDHAADLDRRYASSNDEIAITYCGRDHFFLEAERRCREHFDGLNATELSEFVAQIVVDQQRAIEELQRRLRALDGLDHRLSPTDATPRSRASLLAGCNQNEADLDGIY